MAAKRIIKFVLRLAVAAAILVGGYFLIKTLTQKNRDGELIAEATISEQLNTKLLESRQGINDNALGALKSRVNACDKINDVLIKYYNYYVSLSLFENESNGGERSDVLNKIDELLDNVETTIEYVNLFETSNADILQARVKLAAESYVEQTKIFFEVVELLKDYVYHSNYQLQNTGIVYEAQLEMMKDYSKTVFYEGIYGKLDNTNPSVITQSNATTSFKDALDKFNEKYGESSENIENVNSTNELLFTKFYMSLDKTTLYGYYKSNESEKLTYIASLEGSVKTGFQYLQAYLEGSF